MNCISPALVPVILIEIDYRSNMQVILQTISAGRLKDSPGKNSIVISSVSEEIFACCPAAGMAGSWRNYGKNLPPVCMALRVIILPWARKLKTRRLFPLPISAESLLERFIYGANTVICPEDPGKERKKGELDWEEIEKNICRGFDYKRVCSGSPWPASEELAAGGYSEEFIRAAYIKLYVYTANRLKDVASPGLIS